MTLPRRGSRSLVVDGVSYRWRVRTRPTPSQRTGRSPLGIAAERQAASGATLVVPLLRLHPGNHGLERTHPVTPGEVAKVVRAAVEAGWDPLRTGPQFVFRPARVPGPSSGAPEIGGDELDRAAIEDLVRRRSSRETFRLREDLPPVEWSGGGRYQGLRIEIDHRDLMDWVREAERPHVVREVGARPDLIPADYLPPSASFRTSRELFGEVPSHEVRAFISRAPDRVRDKTTLLTCSCGVGECNFVLVRITVLPDVVVWSDFESFHRTWIYDLGPFVFDRALYEAEFDPPSGAALDA